MAAILEWINRMIWGAPALILILCVGLYLTVRAGFPQVRLFGASQREFWKKLKPESNGQDSSSFRALCTALAATVGTGNLAGVAGAIAIGGPGAVFWMWCGGFLGMATKYAEAVLSVRYRVQKKDGSYLGGPMYIISKGLTSKWRFLAAFYCFFGIMASFGVGNATQVNTMIGGINQALGSLGVSESTGRNLLIGMGLAILVLVILFGGAKRIISAAEFLVPFAAGLYIVLSVLCLIRRFDRIPEAFLQIFKGAFSPRSVTGGMVGSCFLSLKTGISRGVFTNEAGMGTAAIAHGTANVRHPAEQGLMGITEVFLDTIVICTLTALVILCSDLPIPYGTDAGLRLTSTAFVSLIGSWTSLVLAAVVCCFAFATILGWSFYGARCAEFIFGEKSWKWYAAAQGGAVLLGTVLNTKTVWIGSEIFNGLMAVPNLIALAVLTPEVIRLTSEYCSFKSYTGRPIKEKKKCFLLHNRR